MVDAGGEDEQISRGHGDADESRISRVWRLQRQPCAASVSSIQRQAIEEVV